MFSEHVFVPRGYSSFIDSSTTLLSNFEIKPDAIVPCSFGDGYALQPATSGVRLRGLGNAVAANYTAQNLARLKYDPAT